MERRYDLIIIGAGPAGMGTTIYGGRAGLKTVILEMDAPGEKLIKTAETSNWPGIIETNGAKLASGMFGHSISLDTEYLYGNVIRVEDGAYRKIVCEDGTEYKAKTVTVTIGTQERMMNMLGELEDVGHGVSYYVACDDTFLHDQEVVVIGGGSSALEGTNYLAQSANKVNIIIRRDVFRVDSIVQSAIKDSPKITVVTKHAPVCVVDDSMHVTDPVIQDADTSVEAEMRTHGIFPYIELDPATSPLKGLGIPSERGCMIVGGNYETKAKDIYGAGDVIARKLHQIVTATNDGAIVAQYAFHEVKGI